MKIDINPLSNEAGKILQSFKEKVIDKKKFDLEISLKKDNELYKKKEIIYESYIKLYKLMCELNMQHIIMVECFKVIIEKMISINLKESIDTGRLLPSQIKEFNNIWVCMDEIYKFFSK
jgi:hypothetical protein